MPEEIPPELWDRVAAELARQKNETRERRGRRALWAVSTAALALAVIAVAFSATVIARPETVGLARQDDLEATERFGRNLEGQVERRTADIKSVWREIALIEWMVGRECNFAPVLYDFAGIPNGGSRDVLEEECVQFQSATGYDPQFDPTP